MGAEAPVQRRVMRCWSLSGADEAREAAGEGEDENRTFASFCLCREGPGTRPEELYRCGAGEDHLHSLPRARFLFFVFIFGFLGAKRARGRCQPQSTPGRNSAVRAVELSRAVMFDAAAGALRPP